MTAGTFRTIAYSLGVYAALTGRPGLGVAFVAAVFLVAVTS